MVAEVYFKSAKKRQVILDLLNEYGPLTPKELIDKSELTKSSIYITLKRMIESKEVEQQEEYKINALVQTTMSAEETLKSKDAKQAATKSYYQETSKNLPKGFTRSVVHRLSNKQSNDKVMIHKSEKIHSSIRKYTSSSISSVFW